MEKANYSISLSFNDIDDRLEIVNRTKSYTVSKKLVCSSIPYFEKMFCCDLLESKDRKVTLNLNESGFNNVLSYVQSEIYFLTMENVIQTYGCCDYLMIDVYKSECERYFYENFNVDYLPIVLDAIAESPQMITPQTINWFIRKYFLKISITKAFLCYSISVIEYILRLDLIIDSEYQVFEAIQRWIKFSQEDRIKYLSQLLKLVRWNENYEDHLAKIQGELSDNFHDWVKIESLSAKFNSSPSRVASKFPLIINQVDNEDNSISVSIMNGPKFCLPCGNFEKDDSISSSIIIDEHFTDVIYDSKQKYIRIDWHNKKFRYLDILGSSESICGQLFRYIMYNFSEIDKMKKLKWLMIDHINDLYCVESREYKFMDINDHFITLGLKKNSQSYHLEDFDYLRLLDKGRCPPDSQSAEKIHHACLIGDDIFVIKQNLKMLHLNKAASSVKMLSSFNDKNFSFEDLDLFSHNGELYLCPKSTKKVFIFNPSTSDWSLCFEVLTPKPIIAFSSAAFACCERADNLRKIQTLVPKMQNSKRKVQIRSEENQEKQD